MCRNIRPLYNYLSPATEEEMRASALQFVRKVSGFTKPSQANEPAFERAVDRITAEVRALLDTLVTNAEPHHREMEIRKAKARAAKRFEAVPAKT